MIKKITDTEFNDLITQAMNELPQKYIKGLDNVAIVIADNPTPEQQRKMHLNNQHLLLGLYEGIPLTERDGYNLVLPDKITLFKNQITTVVHNKSELFEQVKRTLWHEIAHYYGLNHDRINYLQNKKHDRKLLI
jgi:predicted Zn-dependent protease with MMP-like domain